MRIKRSHIIILLIVGFVLLNGFTNDNPYFRITDKDVVLKIPAGFPKPVYDFRNNKLSPEVFVLGRALFYDPLLSSDSSTSCATCHQRISAFAHIDHRLSHGINGLIGKRNVSALQNLIWKDSYMWDGGVNNLEVQPINPITNPVEMNESLANVVAKLRANKDYREMFHDAYRDTVINSQRVLKSLAQFTGLMISANSRYDKYLKNTDTFSATEKHGLQLFRSNCASCHKEPLFTDNSYRNNGILADTSLNDLGHGAVTGIAKDNYSFKVPSLRNVGLTYPYMHDGRFKNLEEVLRHYTAITPATPADIVLKKKMELSQQDQKDIVSFLKTLTDKEFIYDKRFIDPSMVN